MHAMSIEKKNYVFDKPEVRLQLFRPLPLPQPVSTILHNESPANEASYGLSYQHLEQPHLFFVFLTAPKRDPAY